MSGAHRTVIIVDCKRESGENCGPEVSFGMPLKTSNHMINLISELKAPGDPKFTAQRTILSNCVEGVSEYCRILYDLFPSTGLVNVITAGSKAKRINTWAPEQQTMKHVTIAFLSSPNGRCIG